VDFSEKIDFYDFDMFRLDLKQQKLFKRGEMILLTPKAYQTLRILVSRAGEIVEKEEMISELWKDSFVEEANLSQYIYLLRKIIGKDEKGEQIIETINKRGFRFTASVTKTASNLPPQNANGETVRSAPTFSTVNISSDSDNDTFNKKVFRNHGILKKILRNSRFFLPGLAIILLIAAVTITGAYIFSDRQNNEPDQIIRSIAILPFRSIDPESNDPKFGLGMSDSIIMQLSKLQKVAVRPTSAIFRFTDNQEIDPVSAGKALNVEAILEGTVQRDSDRVRVSVRLLRVSDNKILWAETFDSPYQNIFDLQDSISRKVSESLALNLTQQQQQTLAERYTSNTEAFQAYQLGIYFWNTRTKSGLQKAANYFEQATRLDQNYALSYAMLADSFNMLGYYNFADKQEMLKKARPMAEKALQLNDKIAESHLALAYIQQNTPGEEEHETESLQRAIELSPYNSTAHIRYGWSFIPQKNLEETVRQIRIGQENDPLSPTANNALCTVLMFHRNFDEGLKYCEKAYEIAPDSPANRLALARVYFLSGKYEEAFQKVNEELAIGKENSEKIFALGLLGYLNAKTNRREEAEKIVSRLKTEVENDPRGIGYLVLILYALDHKDEAFTYFSKAQKIKTIPPGSQFDPMYNDVLADSRFSSLFP
jgi:TolB-like protein/DNA-binding winged helix-turn-helix (wHTH) protein/Tfp pilus assembly protein PilF